MFHRHLNSHIAYPGIPPINKHLLSKNNEAYISRQDKTNFDSKSFFQQLQRNLQLLNPEIFDATLQMNFKSLFSNFINTVERTVKLNAPFKKLSRKQRKIAAKPRLSKERLNLIKQKQNLYYIVACFEL